MCFSPFSEWSYHKAVQPGRTFSVFCRNMSTVRKKSLGSATSTVVIYMPHKQVVRNRHTESCFWEILTQMSSPQSFHATEQNTERKQLHSDNECFQEQEVVHCVHPYPVLSIPQVTKAATEEWITESEVTGTSHCSGAGLPPKLASQGCQGIEAGDIFGYHYPHQEPVQVKGFLSHSPVLFFSPSCSQPVQELVSNPSPLSHPSLVHFQSIGKVSWTHLGIGIWKIELIQTVFPCIQETSDC